MSPQTPDKTNRPRASTSPTRELLDLLGRRWTLRILWELREGALTFGELHERCDSMSTSVLSQRLGELRDAGIVERDAAAGHRLTSHGEALLARLRWFDEWASQWARRGSSVGR